MTNEGSRYVKQTRFAPFGEAGQQGLREAKVLLCGCGALGTVIAERLVRAGVGAIRIVDRDWVEMGNLHRQGLFTEADALASRPKAVAAAVALQGMNSQVEIDAQVDDLTFRNIEHLAAGCTLLLDGTDNFETRYLINDYCWSQGVPWVHGGCLGAGGQVATFIPGATACFRCLLPEPPLREAMETCDTAGVLGPAVGLIANWQAAEALKLVARVPYNETRLIVLDSWEPSARVIKLPPADNCPTCQRNEFPFLTGEISSEMTILCGKNAVQIDSRSATGAGLGFVDGPAGFDSLEAKLQGLGPVVKNSFLIRLSLGEHSLTIFRGGRIVVEGTTSPALARSIVARTLGQ